MEDEVSNQEKDPANEVNYQELDQTNVVNNQEKYQTNVVNNKEPQDEISIKISSNFITLTTCMLKSIIKIITFILVLCIA